MVKAKEESDDDDETPATPAKRKADNRRPPPAKKAKSESDGYVLVGGNLNSNKHFEIKEALAAFFSKKNLEVQDVRLGASKKFGYVEFASGEDGLGAERQEVHGTGVEDV
ncbi:nucleolin-like isoform X2 [Oncorhynchus masou masou]|uniref:nucleolin-like isoform X2 n=1 Tax=Oncorhynchus masou masou TaxID=90313 RepID=UPI003182C439